MSYELGCTHSLPPPQSVPFPAIRGNGQKLQEQSEASPSHRQVINKAVSLFLRFGRIEAQVLLNTPANEQKQTPPLHKQNTAHPSVELLISVKGFFCI